MVDVLPDVGPRADGRQDGHRAAGAPVRRARAAGRASTCAFTLSGYVDGLLARRVEPPAHACVGRGDQAPRLATRPRPTDLRRARLADASTSALGVSRVVWGRLDEFQPTDVVNPIDLTRFLLEGRSEARLPVAWCAAACSCRARRRSRRSSCRSFRASRFDQLDEETSPFNLARRRDRRSPRREPDVGAGAACRAAPGSRRRWRGSTGGVGRIAASDLSG